MNTILKRHPQIHPCDAVLAVVKAGHQLSQFKKAA
jgi:hypothetical protein